MKAYLLCLVAAIIVEFAGGGAALATPCPGSEATPAPSDRIRTDRRWEERINLVGSDREAQLLIANEMLQASETPAGGCDAHLLRQLGQLQDTLGQPKNAYDTYRRFREISTSTADLSDEAREVLANDRRFVDDRYVRLSVMALLSFKPADQLSAGEDLVVTLAKPGTNKRHILSNRLLGEYLANSRQLELDPGLWEVTVQQGACLSKERRQLEAFQVSSGQDEILVRAPFCGDRSDAWKYTLAGTAILTTAFVVTGIVAIRKNQAFDDANDRTQVERARSLRNSGTALNIVADVLLGAGLVGGAATTYLLLSDAQEPTGFVVSASGRF